ncbi:pyridoxal-phosphate dependent enzyme [Micromonospora sp. NPDC020750]|uniref:pyridoxal-phosphate dependent enzyme n=1 Tax=unclassified Micromonospora TaxID=2617518 RepID=UPI00378CC8CD
MQLDGSGPGRAPSAGPPAPPGRRRRRPAGRGSRTATARPALAGHRPSPPGNGGPPRRRTGRWPPTTRPRWRPGDRGRRPAAGVGPGADRRRGLISGAAAAVRTAAPTARIVGVEPVTANAIGHALRTGNAALPERPRSMADGLAAPFAGRHTLAHVRALVDDVVEVSEDEIRDTWWELLDATKLLVEPAAAVTLAALRTGLVSAAPGTRTVLVLSGGNVSPATLSTLA